MRIERWQTPNGYWMTGVIRGARNPMNSWDRMDSDVDFDCMGVSGLELGSNDEKMLMRLATAGPDHGKFLRQMPVMMEITAPLHWWKQMDQYKVGTTTNSCSTMHKLTEKEFELKDFEIDSASDPRIAPVWESLIDTLNLLRAQYIDTGDKKAWRMIVELLPESYLQKRTWTANYQVLRTIYHQRKNHKLVEWREFCQCIEDLPLSDFITEV